ncbi:HNH endonuclease [Streptomyces enissocaesilis]|uniref:HNH nuclease domain-containing protein n=1 Tax=Streptomyces enissocaesilis TaxID=332589 RepID=A0ABN3XN23_9ACTN
MAVSKRLRYEVLRRDNHTCRYCGAKAPNVPLRVDHVVPVALGGTDTPANLVTSCEPCNSGKSSATVDSALVENVADDAIRWAAAMQQAADDLLEQEKPKLEYRAAFLKEWNRWGYGEGEDRKAIELPGDWKASVERFRVAGLPPWVWADIVDVAMGNDKVLDANKFKYCCGIAWNKVGVLQEGARRIVGASRPPARLDVRQAVLEAAFTVWHCGLTDNEDAPTPQQADEFRESLAALTDEDLTEPELIVQAAQHATYFSLTSFAEARRNMDYDAIFRAWHSAWPTTWVPGDEPWGGKFVGGPTDHQSKWVREQIDKLLDAKTHVRRLVRAASHAGSHKSARIYHGLSDDELEVTGVSGWQSKAGELWRVAYTASDMVEPTEEETASFFKGLRRIVSLGEFYLADIYQAASAAGCYQDPDLMPCLTQHLSVFEAAALPVWDEG